jgi:hypothetical protein
MTAYRPIRGGVGIEHNRGPLEPGRDLREQLKPLASHRCFAGGEAGGVPTQAVEPRDDAAGDGIGHARKDDWDRPRLPLEGHGRRGRACQYDVGLQADQLLRERSHPIDVIDIEWAFARNWTVKFEYDYLGLGSRTIVVPAGAPFLLGDTFTLGRNVQEAKVGINYLFNWGAGPGPY